jgi:hypothetical protein
MRRRVRQHAGAHVFCDEKGEKARDNQQKVMSKRCSQDGGTNRAPTNAKDDASRAGMPEMQVYATLKKWDKQYRYTPPPRYSQFSLSRRGGGMRVQLSCDRLHLYLLDEPGNRWDRRRMPTLKVARCFR